MTRPAQHILRLMSLAAIVVVCIGCDQVTKSAAISHLKGQAPRAYCGGTLRLEYAENPGAFLSLGTNWPRLTRLMVLTVANCVLMVSIAVLLLVRWNMPAWSFAACALLLSGGVGNLIDRVRYDGLVIDFLNLGIGPLRTGIFNVADMAVMAGALGLLLATSTKRADAAPSNPT